MKCIRDGEWLSQDSIAQQLPEFLQIPCPWKTAAGANDRDWLSFLALDGVQLRLQILDGQICALIRGYPSKDERDKRLKAAHDDPEFREVVGNDPNKPIIKAHNIDMAPNGAYTAINVTP